MCHQQIGAGDCLQQIFITVAHSRKHKSLHEKLWPSLWLHDLLDQFRALFFGWWYVRPHGCELQARAGDLFSIPLHRCDHRRVPAALQLHRDGHVRMNIAEGTKRVEDDAHR